MKLALYDDFKLGVIRGDGVVNVDTVLSPKNGTTPQQVMESVIQDFQRLRPSLEKAAATGQVIPLSHVRLRAPLPKPGKIICAAVNYLEYGTRHRGPLDCFLKPGSAVIGHGDTVILPDCAASVFQHEAELGVIIGKRAKNVPLETAMEYVFGYTNFNDVSARDLKPMGFISFFMIKSWDTFAPMGPAIVTADEIKDPHNLDVKLWNNGELRQDFNTSDMANRIPDQIHFASTIMTLEPGDVIATGTNHQGLGAMQHGDVLDMEITGLGRLTFKVDDPKRRSWPRGIDKKLAAQVRGPLPPNR